MQRRSLDFDSAEQVIEDIGHLRVAGYERLGKWSLTQVCQHLTATMESGIDGFDFRLPWIVRATLGSWAFRRALTTRKMGTGIPTFSRLKPTHQSPTDDAVVIDQCIATCQKARDFAGPIRNHPLLNEVSVDDWRDLMWIHASHHLSFLVPNDLPES